MKRLLSVLLATAALAASAASPTRQWDEGPLQWSDFKGDPAIKSTPTYFKGYLTIVTNVETSSSSRFSDDVSYATSAVALMDEGSSYADSTYRTPQALRYHQLQFDLLEIARRRLQADLNTGMTGLEADSRVAHYQRIYDEQVADLARQTVNGSNDQRLQNYEYMARKQLDEYTLPGVPEVSPGPFSAGFFAGTGVLIPTGDIADLFEYTWVFNIGLQGGYRRWTLKADISYGQASLENPLSDPFGRTYAANHRYQASDSYAKQLSGTVTLGFRVVDTKRFAITPHVGGGWTNYAWNYAEYENNEPGTPNDGWVAASEMKKDSFHNFNFACGIDFDWRFHTVVSDKPLFASGKREQYTSSLRVTPYLIRQSYSSLSPDVKGFHVGIHVTYSGLIRALSIR